MSSTRFTFFDNFLILCMFEFGISCLRVFWAIALLIGLIYVGIIVFINKRVFLFHLGQILVVVDLSLELSVFLSLSNLVLFKFFYGL